MAEIIFYKVHRLPYYGEKGLINLMHKGNTPTGALVIEAPSRAIEEQLAGI